MQLPTTKKYCSRVGDEEGSLCLHGDDVIRTDHWSCCGVSTRQAACTMVRAHTHTRAHTHILMPIPVVTPVRLPPAPPRSYVPDVHGLYQVSEWLPL